MFVRLFLGILLALGLSGGAVASTVTIAVVNDATTFDPHFATDKTTVSINEHIYEGLLKRDAQGAIKPVLADSWKLDDDQVTWIFHLREGVRFTDGTPFNAEAAKISLDRILDPKTGAAGRARLSGVKSVDVVDAYTLKVTTKYPWPDLIDGLAGNATRIISPRALELQGAQISRHPVGTGPFKLSVHKVGNEVVLERNGDYWGGKPAYDRLVASVVPEASVRSSLVQVGQVDIALTIDPENVATLEKSADVRVEVAPSTFSVFYMFNMRKKPMDDPRIREAITLAVDREAIVSRLLGSGAEVTRNFFSEGVQYRKDLKPVPYDPGKARELLRAAGYAKGLNLTIWSAHRYLKDQQVAEAIQAYLRQVGIIATIDIADWGTHWARINKDEKSADLYLLATTIPEPTYRFEWNFGRNAGRYSNGYGNEELWNIIETASRTIDETKRAELFGQLQDRVWKDLPYLFLYDRKLINAVRSGVSGFIVNPREMWDLTQVRRKD